MSTQTILHDQWPRTQFCGIITVNLFTYHKANIALSSRDEQKLGKNNGKLYHMVKLKCYNGKSNFVSWWDTSNFVIAVPKESI